MDEYRPWPQQNMTTERWKNEVPVVEVHVDELIFTQQDMRVIDVIRALQRRLPYSGDWFPHVVKWQGKLYLEDGHHRVAAHMLTNQKKRISARVLEIVEA